MTRDQATKLCREELDKHGLKDWHVRLNMNADGRFLGLCSHKDKCIIMNAHHIDIHPDPDIINTIKHEVAHALTVGHGHDEVWAKKAREIGCDNTSPCSNLSLSPDIIDAIRSGAQVSVTFDEEIIRKPKYEITRLQDKCDTCGKVAVVKSENLLENDDPIRPNIKLLHLECGHTLIKKIPKGTPFATLVTDPNEEHVKNCKHDWVINQCKKCLCYKPYKFQLEGMEFIEKALSINKGAAIFDEMGLGKTIQTLGYLKFHPEAFPVLYIAKKKIKFQWFKQVLTWIGPEYMCQMISSSNDILIPGLKGYIVSFDMLVPKTRKSKKGKEIKQGFDITKFNGVIKTVIIDECQQIKNPDSTRTQQVRRIVKDKQVIALSGTPWKNRGSEFFSVLNMLAPMKFPSYEGFIRQWVDRWTDSDGKVKEGGIRNPTRFKEYIKDIVIRREIADVDVEMPDVNRTEFACDLDDIEQSTYDDAESEFVKWYNDFVISGTEDNINGMHILAKLSRMRHITGLAKIPATIEFAEEFFEDTDRKLVVFTHHKDVAAILYDEFTKKFGQDIPVFHYKAELNEVAGFQMQEAFNKAPRAFMIASELAAGEGVNLQSCADAILHERQWNPQNEDQAAPGRFRRIGSEHKHVNVIYVHADGTVDTILHGIVERKRVAFHNAMNKGEVPQWREDDIAKEMATAIVARWKEKNKNKPKKDDEGPSFGQRMRA